MSETGQLTGVSGEDVEAVRRFNRFHTRLIGALNEGLLNSEFSLVQARLLYEIAAASKRDAVSASDLVRVLGLDAGYLSRLITQLEDRGLIERTPSRENAKRLDLHLTREGSAAFGALNDTSVKQVARLLSGLEPSEQRQLVGAMQRIEQVLGSRTKDTTFILRPPQPGDLGWITYRQAFLYARDYALDWSFEALVAEVVAKFVRDFLPEKEQCWIAEQQGEIVGSVFLVRKDDDTAKLRLLYVEPSVRGAGLGSRLVSECIRFARARDYKHIVLWTNSFLVSARRIYESSGFRLVEEKPHHSFGHDLVGQHWRKDL